MRNVQGATVVWNQLIRLVNNVSPFWGITVSTDPATGLVSFNGTSTSSGGRNNYIARNIPLVAGHKYLLLDTINYTSGNTVKWTLSDATTTGYVAELTGGTIYTANSDRTCWIGKNIASAGEVYDCSGYVSMYDLTQMFGSGNEPATVAEFKRMFPEPYYPYSEPTLKSVRIAGIKSTGVNMLYEKRPESAFHGSFGNGSSAIGTASNAYIVGVPVIPNSDIACRSDESRGNDISLAVGNESPKVGSSCTYIASMGNRSAYTFNVGSHSWIYVRYTAEAAFAQIDERHMMLGYAPLPNNYVPHTDGETLDSVEWETQTLRAAGSVRDELTAGELVTRVGVVDLGTLTWVYNSSQDLMYASTGPFNGMPKANSDKLRTTATYTKAYFTGDSKLLRLYGTGYTTPADFKAAMDGVLLYYELATPTTTPISPALPMTYRVEQSGTESIIVPEGEISATPLITLAEGETASDVVMDALAAIAAPDDPIATANHAVGTYLTMQGKLYKVTSAIAVGESIVTGTNVTETTVMDSSSYELPPATTSTLGGVKVGSGLTVAADGTASIADGAVTGIKLAQDVKEAINISSAADALMGDPSESTWSRRTSTGSGMARVESVQGATVVFQQSNRNNTFTAESRGVTFTKNNNGSWTLNGTAVANTSKTFDSGASLVAQHKYLVMGCPSGGSVNTYFMGFGGLEIDFGSGGIWTNPSYPSSNLRLDVKSGATFDNVTIWPQFFDLTAMFGAGNEPATVAEFERMFPEPYYPYSAPTLKPVQIAGIRSTDANGDALDGVEWTAQTLWGAGTAGDMLYADRIETHMGVVDLGTVRWIVGNTKVSGSYEMLSDTLRPVVKIPPTSSVVTNIRCLNYDTRSGNDVYLNNKGIAILANGNIAVFDPDYNQQDSPAAFKAAMSGVYLWYELATPTTTPISPALPMTYRVQAGGSESIIVPDGEVSAAPVLTVAEGESAADVVMDALAAIATPDGPVATANHAINSYLTMGGKLYKVTRAIAVGESIVAGTNVTETTVMDDTRMVVLEYGVSTWDDFLAAYEANRIVYCRVRYSGGFRMAFLAWVQTSLTSTGELFAEFQYYRSLSMHSDAAQGDEIHIYKLSSNGTWTTTVRNAYTRIVAGDGLKSTYANGALTLSNDAIYELPPATTDTLGGVKVGDGLSVAADGTASIADGSITDSMLAPDGIKAHVGQLWGNQLMGELTGEVLTASDAYAAPPMALTVEGNSTQAGTPAPDALVPIESVVNPALTFAGKNLLDVGKWERDTGSGITLVEGDTALDVAQAGYQEQRNRYMLPARASYTLSCDYETISLTNSNASAAIAAFDASGARIALTRLYLRSVGSRGSATLSVPTNSSYLAFGTWTYGGHIIVRNLQLELGSTATDYEPYNATTVPLYDGTLRSLPDGTRDTLNLSYLRPSTREGWAVYAASVTRRVATVTVDGTDKRIWGVTQASGHTHALVDFGAGQLLYKPTAVTCACDRLKGLSGNAEWSATSGIGVANDRFIRFVHPDIDGMTAAEVNAWLTQNALFAQYPPATPITTQLDPIELPVLPAPNCTVWSDPTTGLQMEYVQDTSIVIAGLQAAIAIPDGSIATSDGPTATNNHAVNTYLTMGGKLYKVTKAIAVGEQITSGTNVTQTTVMDELLALTN